jgi:hypothetical protein
MDESNKRKMKALLKKNMDFGPVPQRKKTIGCI